MTIIRIEPGEGEPQVVVQAAHHQGGRDQLVEEPEPRHLHRQGLQHLPRLLWPGLEGFPPCSKLHNTKKDISGGNSSTERATAADKWATEFGRAGEKDLLKLNRSWIGPLEGEAFPDRAYEQGGEAEGLQVWTSQTTFSQHLDLFPQQRTSVRKFVSADIPAHTHWYIIYSYINILMIFHSIYFHSNEPVFASLSALIYQHTLTPLALPIRLVLPQVGILGWCWYK